MDLAAYIAATQAQGDLLATSAEGNMDADIPALDWTVAEAVAHTGGVHRYVAALSEVPDGTEVSFRQVATAPDQGVLAWYREGLDLLVAALQAMDPEEPATTWAGETVPRRWYGRRMAHETAVHRWDVESAAGTPEPIDPELARDGIDEILQDYVPFRFDGDAWGAGDATLHFHATDGEGEWLVTVTDGQVAWEHGHAKGDVAARAPSSDLLLLLWGRLPTSRVELFGEAAILDRWQAATNF